MKMILAVMQKEDELTTVRKLNEREFFVTKLATTGGFLKNRNSTILIGTEDEKVQEAVDIIREFAGKRMVVRYNAAGMETGAMCSGDMTYAYNVEAGGCTVFVYPIESMEKY